MWGSFILRAGALTTSRSKYDAACRNVHYQLRVLGMEKFNGLSEETYKFFWETAFNNSISFYENNRDRYDKYVKQPLLSLAAELAPTALEIDPNFQTRPHAVLSRIRRDTRYVKDLEPLRDHAYLSFKHSGAYQGESFVIFVPFSKDTYGIGVGIYSINPTFMANTRKQILARPAYFMELIKKLDEKFLLTGEEYKRPKCPDAPKELWPWLNKRRFYYEYECTALSNTFSRDVLYEIIDLLQEIKPLYRFIMGMD